LKSLGGGFLLHKGKKLEIKEDFNDFGGFGNEIRNELSKRIPLKLNLKVLDVGTGFGSNALFLAKSLKNNCEIYSLDPSEEALKRAEALLEKEGLKSRVRFKLGKAENIPFPDNFFDIVLAVMTFHHLESLEVSLKEIARVLKNDGKLIIVDWKPKAAIFTPHSKNELFESYEIESIAEKFYSKTFKKEADYWYLLECIK
jgi:ubiquinone/menaquinone biosynthesis C-methylase UbiE